MSKKTRVEENETLSSMLKCLNPIIINDNKHLNFLLEQEGIIISQDKENIAIRLKHFAAKMNKDHKYFYMEISERDFTTKHKEWMLFENFTFNEKEKVYTGFNTNTGVMFCVKLVESKEIPFDDPLLL